MNVLFNRLKTLSADDMLDFACVLCGYGRIYTKLGKPCG